MSWLDSVTDFVSGTWDTVKNFVGGDSSNGGGRDRDYGGSYSTSTSSTVTNYDPDKVEVAKLENERVDLVKIAQLELMEVNARLEAVMIEARCKGFQAMQGSMMQMLKEVNHLAEERLVLLENGSQEQIQKVESMYADLSKDMDNDDFMFSKVPQMLCQIVVASVVASKEKMQHHIDTVISKRIEHIEQVMQVNAQLPYNTTTKIGGGESLKIEQKS